MMRSRPGAHHAQEQVQLTPDHRRPEAHRHWRFIGKAERKVSFSSINCFALLTIADTVHIRKALTQGIGPQKAFGYSLLLIRSAQIMLSIDGTKWIADGYFYRTRPARTNRRTDKGC